MLITIIYIGSSNNLLQDVVGDYEKRIKNIGRNIGLKEINYKEIKNSNKKNVSEKKDEETKKLIDQKEKGALNILLDIEGSKLNSVEFSEYILSQADINQNINFFIGGSEGIDKKHFGFNQLNVQTKKPEQKLWLEKNIIVSIFRDMLIRDW